MLPYVVELSVMGAGSGEDLVAVPVAGRLLGLPRSMILLVLARIRSSGHLVAVALLLLAFALSRFTLYLLAESDWFGAIASGFAGLAALLVAFRLGPAARPLESITHTPIVGVADYGRMGLVAVGLACVMALGTTVHLVAAPNIDWTLPLLPLALVLGWCGEGWLRGRGLRARFQHIAGMVRAHRIELLWLASLTVAGFTLRFWIATRYTLLHGTQNDELEVGRDAWQLVHGTSPWPLYVVEHGAAALFQPVGLMFALFGTSMLTFRLTFVLENSFLVPAFYLLARQFAGAPVALCGTALLALAYWPATLGTMAFGMMYGAVFQSLGLGLLLYGIRRESYAATVAGGAVLTLCFYSYLGARVMPLAAVPILLAFLIAGPGTVRRRLALLLAFCFGFVVVFAPWVSTIYSNRDLLYGDAPGIGQRFMTTLHTHPFDAIHTALDFAGRLIMTIMASPQTFTYFPLPSGGLLDVITAALVLPAVGYAVVRCWKPQNLLIVFGLLPPLAAGSVVGAESLNVYRLGSLVPVLFLAVVLLLDRCVALAYRVPGSARYAITALIVIGGWGSLMNVQTVVTHVGDTAYLCQTTDFFNSLRSEDVMIAEAVNPLGPQQAVFEVTHDRGYEEPVKGPWLLHMAPPLVYNARSGSPDPAQWSLLYGSPPLQVGPKYAVFWPPRLGIGQTGITYVIFDDDQSVLLPLLEHYYPTGQMRIVQPVGCPTNYSLITYTLTPQQLASARAQP